MVEGRYTGTRNTYIHVCDMYMYVYMYTSCVHAAV